MGNSTAAGAVPWLTVPVHKNAWDLLRLIAASMVLYSHQYALLGLPEPSLLGWTSFGTAGVAIFFFLSGYLVWSSWERDPSAWRFFVRRALRIFPALWVVCLLSILVLGPLASDLPIGDYFSSDLTWRYLETGLLNPHKVLPGLFVANPMPGIVNGSLWTLPLEFLCYISVAVAGLACLRAARFKSIALSLLLLGFVLMACYARQLLGARYAPHLEMAAFFWWGVLYANSVKRIPDPLSLTVTAVALLAFGVLGDGSFARMALLVVVACAVHAAGRVSWGAKLTGVIGDLSYGVYIVAFPVQQWVVQRGRENGWSMHTYFSVSILATYALAYVSWHGIEKRALLFKPKNPGAK